MSEEKVKQGLEDFGEFQEEKLNESVLSKQEEKDEQPA